VHSSGWIATEYYNQYYQNDFCDIGTEVKNYIEIPVLSNEYPINNSIDISLNPVFSIHVEDPQGDNMNIRFWTNASGAWTNIGTNNSVSNGTYHCYNTVDIDSYSKKILVECECNRCWI